MNILALDTATEACSVALRRSDGALFEAFELAPREHNRLLPAMLDKVIADSDLERADITHCAYTNGPGAFTGIRIGTARAQGIGLALSIPLVPVSTLAVMAELYFSSHEGQSVIAALDARMGEIYWGQYDRDNAGQTLISGIEHLTSAGTELPTHNVTAIIGSGVTVLTNPPDRNSGIRMLPDYLPRAVAMLPLALRLIADEKTVLASAAPINYLRNQVAEKAKPV